MKKKVCLILTSLLMCLTLSVAYAAEPLAVHLEGFEAAGNSLTVYFNSNSEEELSLLQLSLSVGGQKTKPRSLQHFSRSDSGITYLFLADVSGSIGDEKLLKMKEIMNSIADTMTDRDSASVGTVGNDTVINPFVSGKDEIKNQINAVKGTADDTDLYAAIIKAIDTLGADGQVHTKKCLVILSDGNDDYATGYTREEVEKKIEQNHLPVHTIAMMDAGVGQEAIESSKVFGSFARLSAGGLDLTYSIKEESVDAISDGIVASAAQSYVLTADISGLEGVSDQATLELEVSVEGQGTDSDGYSVDGAQMRAQVVPAATQTAAPSPPAGPSPQPTQTPWMEMTVLTIPMPYVLMIGAAIIAAVILLAVLLRRRRKKLKNKSLIEKTMAADVEIDLLKASAVELRFTKVGPAGGQIFTHRLKDEMVIGRDPAKSKLVFAQDELLSAQHCRIFRRDGKIFISDMNSTNGTYLNGIPVREDHLLEQDDIILLGSMELRINWDK